MEKQRLEQIESELVKLGVITPYTDPDFKYQATCSFNEVWEQNLRSELPQQFDNVKKHDPNLGAFGAILVLTANTVEDFTEKSGKKLDKVDSTDLAMTLLAVLSIHASS